MKKIRTLEFHNESNSECIEILKKKLETLKEKKKGVDGKLEGLLKASKDLDNLIKSQRSDKIKDGLGYSAVPPPPAQLYLSPKKDISWIGLPECADDTVTNYSRPSPTVKSTSGDDQNKNSSAFEIGESTNSIVSKPAVKFMKAAERQKILFQFHHNAVLPPYTGNFMPPKPDLSFPDLEESLNEPIVSEPTIKKPVIETSDAKANTNKHKFVRNNFGPQIIKDWISDSEDEAESKPKIKKKTIKSSFSKIEFVKSKE
uniref:Uncharacterized protein n=1 Tax=Tanacetum cinerariifolium TaxID=118510 RepID=A0A699I4W2_TANCI|nr:hypothetical protein [Tanacetum cinerariifolium]